jgi:hypothetical protein
MKKLLIILVISSIGLICNAKTHTSEFVISDDCTCTTITVKYEFSKKWVLDDYGNRINVKNNIIYVIQRELDDYESISTWTNVEFYLFVDKINKEIEDFFRDCFVIPEIKLTYCNFKSTNYCLKR